MYDNMLKGYDYMSIKLKEKWKQIDDSNYYVSSLGRIITTNHNKNNGAEISINCDGRNIAGYIKSTRLNIKPTKHHHGYLTVQLVLKRKKNHLFYVHRLVAEAFIPNPNNLPTVNHKDGNHLNNKVNNLEWMSYSDNQQHAYDNWLNKGRTGDKIACYTLEGTLIDTYKSMREAERINHMANGSVSQAIKHKWNYNGFFWSRDNSLLPDQVKYILSQNESSRDEQHKKRNYTVHKIDQYDLNGNFIETYNSCAEAARKTGSIGPSISRVVNGKMKQHNGFIWKRHKK